MKSDGFAFVTATPIGVKVPLPDAAGLSPVAELLVWCVRGRSDAPAAERLDAILSSPLEWAEATRLARLHAVTPQVYTHLNRHYASRVPDDVLDELGRRFKQNARRNLFLASELLRLIAVLSEEGIPVVPYRGPVLACSAYGNLALREFQDLDVLVRASDVGRAKTLLLARGFRWFQPLGPIAEAAYLRYGYDHRFESPDRRFWLELHWTPVPGRFVRYDATRLWTRLGRTPLAGSTVPTLAPEDLVHVLCIHGAKHFWERLAWSVDIARILESTPDLRWDVITKDAARAGSTRMLLLGLKLARDLAGAALPASIDAGIRDDTVVADLSRRVRAGLFGARPVDANAMEGFLFHLRAADGLSGRLRYCLSPTPAEPELLALPPPFYPLYYVLRPIRLISQHGASLVRRARRAP